jgi:hypothetical protein
VNTVRAEPTLFAQAQPGSGGAGAVLVVNVVQSGNVWVVNSITVSNGGTGYTDGETFDILPSAGQTVSAANVTVSVSGGVITGASISDAGEYFLDTGVIDTVDVLYGGSYFKDTGVIDSIDISSAGTYYKALGDIESISLVNGGAFFGEDADAPPLVADITVVLDQIDPSAGDGATFTVVVDDDPDSPTFGEITGVTVSNGGDGYEAQGFPNQYCMGEYMNGKSFVLARQKFFVPNFNYSSPDPCVYMTYLCTPLGAGAYDGRFIQFDFNATSPTLAAPNVSFTTSQALSDCGSFEVEFLSPSTSQPAFNNVTATVSSGGGTVEDAFGLVDAGHVLPNDAPAFSSGTGVCGSCCLNEEPTPAEVTVTLANLVEDPVTGDLPDGDYVLVRDPFWESLFPDIYNDNATIWRLAAHDIRVAIEPCSPVDYTGVALHRAYFPSECGDTCYKKCRIKIGISGFGLAGGQYDPGCDCLDFPVCSPPAGEYTLLSGFPAAPYYTATIA